MPLTRYGVLKGKAIGAKREEDQSSPHYQVHIQAGTTHYRIAVNVKSQVSPSELLFLVNDDFHHPITATLPELSVDFTTLQSKPGGHAVDFIRGNLFNRLDMRLLPPNLPGPNNDLSDQIEHYVNRAIPEEMRKSMHLVNVGGRRVIKLTKFSALNQVTAFMTFI